MAAKKSKKSAASEASKAKGSRPAKPPKPPKLPKVGAGNGGGPPPFFEGGGTVGDLAIHADDESIALFIDLGTGPARVATLTALQTFAATLTAGSFFIVKNKGPRKKDDC
jgi:hypothetical protein